MARIGNSVYHDICPEPTCSQFGFYQGGIPTPMMEKCLLYKMVRYGEPGVPPLEPGLSARARLAGPGAILHADGRSARCSAPPRRNLGRGLGIGLV